MNVDTIRDPIDMTTPVIILPVRHHSPACAYHVRRVIEDVRPDMVVVEGPSDANRLINELTDEETSPPVAIYCSVRDESEQGGAYFYPFCTYSPEYVALSTARKLSIESEFIDLPSWWMATLKSDEPRKVNGYSDEGIRHETFIAELCRSTRTRDFDELWDTLFESPGFGQPSESFFTSVATYCLSVRHHFPSDDPLTVRDTFMAARIRDALTAGKRVVAVVGGRHRSGIAAHLAANTSEPKAPKEPKESLRGVYLTRYGYRELDSWSGYQSGMPAPSFYADVWKFRAEEHEQVVAQRSADDSASTKKARKTRRRSSHDGEDSDSSTMSAHLGQVRLLNRVCRYVRSRGVSLSTSDIMAAAASLEGLRRLRQHAYPTLADLRDSIRSTWIKGHDESGESHILSAVETALVGNKIGKVTSRAVLLPIVADFYRLAERYRWLEVEGQTRTSSKKEIKLDIYRSAGHRRRSAFLHRLIELGCPYAKLDAGPDFVHGRDLKRVREIWTLQWRPIVEASLVEAAVHGFSVEEAAANHLLSRAKSNLSRGAASAVEHLSSALVMDFPTLAAEFIDVARLAIQQEASFSEAAEAMAGLIHIAHYRTLLGAAKHPEIADLIGIAYRRAVWLIETLPGLPTTSGAVTPGMITRSPDELAVEGLILLRHAALSPLEDDIDPELLMKALINIRPLLAYHPAIEGAVLGLLSQAGRLDDDELSRSLENVLTNTVSGPDTPLGDFLRGLFAVRRHAISEEDGFFEAIHDCLTHLDEDRFLRSLPSLRLAFTQFTPREIRRLVELVEKALSPLAESADESGIDESVMARTVDETVRAVLSEWEW